MVDVIIRIWVQHVMSSKSGNDGITSKDIRKFLAFFYANNGLVLLQDPITLQQAFGSLTGLFNRVGLWTNARKTT